MKKNKKNTIFENDAFYNDLVNKNRNNIKMSDKLVINVTNDEDNTSNKSLLRISRKLQNLDKKNFNSPFRNENLRLNTDMKINDNFPFINSTRNEKNYISDLIYDTSWFHIDRILVRIVRTWYKTIIEELKLNFFYFVENIKVIYISIYIVLVVLVTLYYFIIWKKYEENFISLIKKSFDLINLIPEEIKNIIVLKLNE